MNANVNDVAGGYGGKYFTEDQVINEALAILAGKLERGEAVTSPDLARKYLQLNLGSRECEYFAVMFLDTKHRVLHIEEMFRGTIDGASVYPREVVKEALKWNAAAVIFAHNHPSGVAEPSAADNAITKRLKDSLAFVDVRVLDHYVVCCGEYVSFTERGLL